MESAETFLHYFACSELTSQTGKFSPQLNSLDRKPQTWQMEMRVNNTRRAAPPPFVYVSKANTLAHLCGAPPLGDCHVCCSRFKSEFLSQMLPKATIVAGVFVAWQSCGMCVSSFGWMPCVLLFTLFPFRLHKDGIRC